MIGIVSVSENSPIELLATARSCARRMASAAKRRVTRAADRLLHTRRRARAKRLISELQPQSIALICHGNICRSPYAAASLARALAGSGVHIESAGFIGPGRQSPLCAQAAAVALGVNLESHSSKLIGEEVLSADLFVVMEPQQARALRMHHHIPRRRTVILGDLDPQSADQRIIDDPFDGSLEVFTSCYRRIERCVVVLAAQIHPRDL